MLNRIKKVIEDSGLNRSSFANSLGVNLSNFSSQLSGKRKVSDRLIALICTRFGVSERWLRDGVGPVYVADLERTESEQLDDAILKVFKALSPEGQAAALRVIERIVKENKAASKNVSIGDNNTNIHIQQ